MKKKNTKLLPLKIFILGIVFYIALGIFSLLYFNILIGSKFISPVAGFLYGPFILASTLPYDMRDFQFIQACKNLSGKELNYENVKTLNGKCLLRDNRKDSKAYTTNMYIDTCTQQDIDLLIQKDSQSRIYNHWWGDSLGRFKDQLDLVVYSKSVNNPLEDGYICSIKVDRKHNNTMKTKPFLGGDD